MRIFFTPRGLLIACTISAFAGAYTMGAFILAIGGL